MWRVFVEENKNPKKTVGGGTKALGGEQNGGSFVHLVKKYM